VNTLILLLSGCTITYTHHGLVSGNYAKTLFGFSETIFYAIFFTILQLDEYIFAPFAISDGIYGSVFYMTTGLHGFHVIVGTCFIFVCALRFFNAHFTREHHLGFEFSAWYWHFVDVVWLFVYVSIYWWGGL
jgi:heme/copper-type cytochrome/quinol oxidase subunit 3